MHCSLGKTALGSVRPVGRADEVLTPPSFIARPLKAPVGVTCFLQFLEFLLRDHLQGQPFTSHRKKSSLMTLLPRFGIRTVCQWLLVNSTYLLTCLAAEGGIPRAGPTIPMPHSSRMQCEGPRHFITINLTSSNNADFKRI